MCALVAGGDLPGYTRHHEVNMNTVRYALLMTLCLGLSLVAYGCDAGDAAAGTSVCAPGETQVCVCPDGSGAQSCNTEGTGWDPCVCIGGYLPRSLPEPPQDATASGTPDTGPTCAPNAEKACEGDVLVWLDACGAFQENLEDCSAVGYCADGACVTACLPQHERRCKGNDVYWFDSCGARGLT